MNTVTITSDSTVPVSGFDELVAGFRISAAPNPAWKSISLPATITEPTTQYSPKAITSPISASLSPKATSCGTLEGTACRLAPFTPTSMTASATVM